HGPQYRTTDPLGAGDGWCQYFEPGSEPFEEHVYEVRVDAFHPWYGPMYDTCFVYIDPTPPIPVFNDIPRDSVGAFAVDSFFDITFRLDDEMAGPGTAWLNVFPLQIDFQRDLTEVDQLGLGTGIDSASCGPAAAASCLKYFADNGYPELDNPGGDESRPDATAEEMARELQDDMGTDAEGTTPAEMVAGIRKYLEGHGQSGWDVNSGEVNDAAGLAEMFREFESDSEDVLVLLQDTTASGDTVGHVVTLGSAHTNYDGDAATPDQSIDFMDPWGGGSQEDNTYPVDDNTDPPTVGGYDVAVGSGGGSWIAGYIKVSPPEGGDGGGGSPPVLGAPARAPWTEVATAVITGNGAVESMGWDTHGFAGGLYLMEITTEDDEGIRCTDIRLAGLLSSPTGGDVPGIKTMLRGSYPNPFNPTTRIEFSLAGRTPVSLVIYDVAGRRVRVLLSKEMRDEGVHI
ncbi:MAG TPA: hypothetical protein VLA34_10575, partial [Candidatus Krumholzibacterium sp.]|nr:hypothetical protein [Candidatus Krumholzibacterium sp.]